jgi:hypothetical protein
MNPIREWSGLGDLTARQPKAPLAPMAPMAPSSAGPGDGSWQGAVPGDSAVVRPMLPDVHEDVHATLHWHFVA